MEIKKIYGTGTCKHMPKGHEFGADKKMADYLVALGRASYTMPEDKKEVGENPFISKEVKESIEAAVIPKKKFNRKKKDA